MASASSSKLVIYAAHAGNLLVAATKFGAAVRTGSSAMRSEGVHSMVDTVNQALMLYGIHRASEPADEQHPLGHGRVHYFWSFVVALLICALGAAVSIYQGVVHILHPEPIGDFRVSYIVLGLSFVFEGATWWIAGSSPGVNKVGRLITVHLAPHQIVAALDIDLTDDLRASEIEEVAQTVEHRIRQANPDVIMIFISPKNASPPKTKPAP